MKPPADLSRLKLVDLEVRPSKVDTKLLGRPWRRGESFRRFMDSLPDVLGAKALKEVAQAIVEARAKGAPVIMAMGAHVIKVGLSPVVIDAMSRGIITAVVMNGAGMIHDVEMALAGHTSEDVAAALADGSFGTARQTGLFINSAVAEAGAELGLGEAVGRAVVERGPKFAELSILGAGVRMGVGVMVHVALGSDIIHMHPSFDPAATARASHLDFRKLITEVGGLRGGVYLNVGSAVVLPEVFLKALSAARNLGMDAHGFTTVNMDMIQHYRPMTNVVHRPVLTGGKGLAIIGHHEINIPLLLAMVTELLQG